MSQLLLRRLSKFSPRNSPLIHEQARRVLSSSAASNPYVSLEISGDLNDQGGGTIIGNVLLFDAAKQDVLTVDKTIPEEMIVEGKGVGASHGWLFMEDQRDRSLSVTDFLNPLASKRETTVIPLPPLTSLQLCQSAVGWNVAMSSSPHQDDEEDDWVVAIKFLGRQLSLCRPHRDLRWTNIQTPLLGYLDNSNLMYSKRDQCFYSPSPGGRHLFSYNIKDKDHPNPKFHVLQFRDLPELPQSEWEILVGSCCRTEYMVESASTGEHFLVKRYLYLSFNSASYFTTKRSGSWYLGRRRRWKEEDTCVTLTTLAMCASFFQLVRLSASKRARSLGLVFTILSPEPPLLFKVHQPSSPPLSGFPHFLSSGMVYPVFICRG
ncbi:hypothetical protein Bca52824_032501 [Brassica carinata]|uniref:KIB1-4 beta-propeller domain-containing protein n=1 Tax=Brassica carinata TaxID=52824 RepID=A0A8X7SEB3_BRACI|nr:hypothetical protein Bca52824_032501 [Brassica carinata]